MRDGIRSGRDTVVYGGSVVDIPGARAGSRWGLIIALGLLVWLRRSRREGLLSVELLLVVHWIIVRHSNDRRCSSTLAERVQPQDPVTQCSFHYLKSYHHCFRVHRKIKNTTHHHRFSGRLRVSCAERREAEHFADDGFDIIWLLYYFEFRAFSM